MENKGILVNVFELETGLTTYKDCEYIRITDEKYNLLKTMLEYDIEDKNNVFNSVYILNFFYFITFHEIPIFLYYIVRTKYVQLNNA